MNNAIVKPRDVQVAPIAVDTFVFRSRTWDRLKFEIEYGLQKGTTANSYLIKGEKVALFDPPGESFSAIFLEALTKRIDPKTIDYIILGHVNPNRAVTLKALLEIAPQVTFVCSNPGAISLKKILETEALNLLVVKGEEILNLGANHQLEFSYYFDCLMAPYASQISNALEKLAAKSPLFYAVGHGPLVRYAMHELTLSYQQWLAVQKYQELTITLIYASAYGNTATLAQAIAMGITKAGVAVTAINAEFAEPDEIKTAIEKSVGFIFGSPTLGGHAPTPIQTALGITLANGDKSKLVGVFGSYGWSGEAIDLLEGKFRDGGYRFGFEPIRVKFKPTEAILKTCEEAGTDFAQAVKKARKSRQPKTNVNQSQSDRRSQALGRLVGSLCIVTCELGELRGAMLASWVSQATFTPPGLTIAVAKERAIESLLYSGTPFVLNILQEGQHIALMKHFLKPFTPGEDRFANIETTKAENGGPILAEALAYLECRVEQRMECGDHWLIYAIAEKGRVLHQGLTAIHHRKSGSYY